jgi:hypothetical protein
MAGTAENSPPSVPSSGGNGRGAVGWVDPVEASRTTVVQRIKAAHDRVGDDFSLTAQTAFYPAATRGDRSER